MLPRKEAYDLVLSCLPEPQTQTVTLACATGRHMAKPLVSGRAIPNCANSAMDGYAFAHHGKSDLKLKLVGEIPAGASPLKDPITSGVCYHILTGAPIPKGADTVVPQEQVELVGDFVQIPRVPPLGAHIRRAGEDVSLDETIDLTGRPLGPGDVGLLASLGVQEVSVFKRPQVAIFGTGEELVPFDQDPQPGQVVNSNNWSLASAVALAGGEPVVLGQSEDSRSSISSMFEKARDCDLILSTGGVSVGDYDYVKEVMEELGVQMKFWKVAIKPGKPLAFGTWENRLCFGLPGNPVSCLVNFELFVVPVLRSLLGYQESSPPSVSVTLKEDFPKASGRTHCLRARINQNSQGGWEAYLTGPQGSGILKSMSLANALVLVEQTQKAGTVAKAFWLTGCHPWL